MNKKKTQIRIRRDEDIFSDFRKLYMVDLLQVVAIYGRLSSKYYLDPDTIARIVYKKRKELRESCEALEIIKNQ